MYAMHLYNTFKTEVLSNSWSSASHLTVFPHTLLIWSKCMWRKVQNAKSSTSHSAATESQSLKMYLEVGIKSGH